MGLWIWKSQVWISVLPVDWLCNILGQDVDSMWASCNSGVNEYWYCYGIMGQAGQAPSCMGMLAASWNLHTKVGLSSPAREVIVKHSTDKYLCVLLAVLYKCATFVFTFDVYFILRYTFCAYCIFETKIMVKFWYRSTHQMYGTITFYGMCTVF